MKKLWIIRHAKSSWDNMQLSDHDRPLNPRGKRDAPFMAMTINEKFLVPQKLYTSTAKRAKATCRAFRNELNMGDNDVVELSQLYHPSMADCMDAIHKIEESIDVAAIFGHNPTFTYLIDELTGEGPDNLPTCGCALITSSSAYWSSFDSFSCDLEVLIYPKMFNRND